MKKTNLQGIILLICLIIASLLWFGPALKQKNAPDSPRGEKDLVLKIEISSEENYFLIQEKLAARRPQTTQIIDPFSWPRQVLAAKETSLLASSSLSGIAADEQGRLAIIRGEIVREGDIIEGFTIKEITGSSVIMEKNGEQHELHLY